MIYDEVRSFYESFSGKKCIIGYSLGGRAIFAMHIGSGVGRQFISVYAVHGREWITSRLALAHIAKGTAEGWGGWTVPLLNPDGAILSQTVRPFWKANLRGVDINCNFDARWGTGSLNTRMRGAENCIGDYPFSEPESKALACFTRKIMPQVTFAFHTKGGEIYWEFAGRGDESGAHILEQVTGYKSKRITGSAGGYKDWCIEKLCIPAYTVECGDDKLVHPIKDIKDIVECTGALRFFTEKWKRNI